MSDGCGHAADDASCKCWGVRVRNADRAEAWAYFAIGGPDERGNYERAYGVACQLRTQYPDTSYRVQRREVLGARILRGAAPYGCKRCGSASGSLYYRGDTLLGCDYCNDDNEPVAALSAICPNCKAAPCDCDKPIWSWVYRNSLHPGGAWRGGRPIGGAQPDVGEFRHVLVDMHAQPQEGINRGPIQRITEPPFQFEPKPVWDAIRRQWDLGGGPMAGYDLVWKTYNAPCACGLYQKLVGARATPADGSIHERERCTTVHGAILSMRLYDPTLDVPPSAPASHKCSLPWCTALTTDRFCGPRCQDFGARLHRIEGRRASFEYKITHGKPRHGHAELAWAKKQTERDIVALERAWHAVQHEAAQGDERFFALLDDEGWS